MRLNIHKAVLIVTLGAVLVGPAEAELLAVSIPGAGNALGQVQNPSIYIVDTTTGTSRFLANTPMGASNLQYNPVANTVSYVSSGAPGGQSATIVTLNAQTGQVISTTQSPSPFLNSPIPLGGITSFAPLYSATATAPDTSQRLSALDQRMTGLEQKTEILDDKIGRVGAMAAALSTQRPAPGKTLRLGLDTGFFDGKAAIGINGSAFVAGSIDVGAGVAFSGGQAMGKVGVGLNW